MSCKDRGINVSVSGCAGNTRDMHARHFWEFPFYHPVLLGISTLPPGTMGTPTSPPAGQKNVAFQRFIRHRKLNFQCRRDKKGI